MSLTHLTAAYAAIAAGEAPVVPHGLAAWKKPANVRKLSKAELDGMRDMLRSAVHRGTGIEAAIPGAFGKTGTTQNYRDAIFVGYVGHLVVGVWVGNDDNTAMHGVVGGGLPARIWKEFTSYAVARRAPKPVEAPDPTAAAEEEFLALPGMTPEEGAEPAAEAAPADPAAPPSEAAPTPAARPLEAPPPPSIVPPPLEKAPPPP